MNGENIISALVGLAGAVSNNGKTENTDAIVIDGILAMEEGSSVEAQLAAVDMVHKEKFIISPSCATCKAPCGNTSDYDLSKLMTLDKTSLALKEESIRRLVNVAKKLKEDHNCNVPDTVYRTIAYFGYDIGEDSYLELFDELEKL